MSPSHSRPHPAERWQTLYENLVSQSQYSLRLDQIADARNAMLDRAEEILTGPSTDERRALSHALRTVRLLEEIAARRTDAA